MNGLNNLEKPTGSENGISERKFELSLNPEGEKIRERLEKEYDRRIGIFKNVLAVLEIPEDSVVLAPPAIDRTDFGYTSDIDLVFLGTDEQREKLYQRLHTSFEILPFIILAMWWIFLPQNVLNFYIWFHRGKIKLPKPIVIRILGFLWLVVIFIGELYKNP